MFQIINKLQDSVLSVSNIKYYAIEIKKLLFKKIINMADNLREKSLNPKIDNSPEELIEIAEETLFN